VDFLRNKQGGGETLAPRKTAKGRFCWGLGLCNYLELLSLCCLLLLLAGCGKSNHTGPSRVAFDPTWYPVEVAGNEARINGFTNDLMMQIAEIGSLNYLLVNGQWDDLLLGLDRKRYDAVLTSLYPYNFYQARYAFSKLFLPTGPVLVMRIDDEFSGWEKMGGKEVAVFSDNDATLIQSYPIILREYDQVSTALTHLVEGRVDGVLLGTLLAVPYVNDLYRTSLKVVTSPLTDEGLRLVTRKDAGPRVMKKFDTGLLLLREDGRYDELLHKWTLGQ